MIPPPFHRSATLLVLLGGLAGCATTDVEVDPGSLDPEGAWGVSDSGVSETSLRLGADGSLDRVVAVFGTESCASSSGTWDLDGNQLVLRITEIAGAPASVQEDYVVELTAGELTLTGAGGVQAFSPISSMPSCVTYGWGDWVGVVQADVDGLAETFSDLLVEIDIGGGQLRITSQFLSCDTCAVEGARLILQADGGSDDLSEGDYTVQNVPDAVRTFYGLYHPTPADPDFLGFDTTRLSPPGSLTLSSVTPERVRGTFEFRGNPRVDGDVGPGGSTSTLLTNGRVDLQYR